MGFNSAFKGLILLEYLKIKIVFRPNITSLLTSCVYQSNLCYFVLIIGCINIVAEIRG